MPFPSLDSDAQIALGVVYEWCYIGRELVIEPGIWAAFPDKCVPKTWARAELTGKVRSPATSIDLLCGLELIQPDSAPMYQRNHVGFNSKWKLPEGRMIEVSTTFDQRTFTYPVPCYMIIPDGRREVQKTEDYYIQRVTIDGETVGLCEGILQKPHRESVLFFNKPGLELALELRVPANDSSLNKIRKLPPARHSVDFRAVHWFGTDYAFTAMQAPIVAMLWDAWENQTLDIGIETLLEAVDAKSSRIVDLFRDNPAWGTMIVDGKTKSTKRLAEPHLA